MQMQAPIEVFEAVIDEASDTPASLRFLSLTCSAFLPRSRYHLFSCIVIRSVQQMELSSQLLDTCPWLPPLIRKVTLSVLLPQDSSNPNVRLLDVVPVHLLPRLPNLRALGMEMGSYEYDVKKGPWLSFHRSALWCYQKYGGRIENLELICVTMEGMSDFIGLVSAFTSIQSLTCSWIDFRRWKESNTLFDSISAGNMLSRPLRIEHLVAGPSLDIRTIEYLLASSAATLSHLVITIESKDKWKSQSHSEWLDRSIVLDRLETAISRLSHLSSLTLGFPSSGDCYIPWEYTDAYRGVTHDIRLATRILNGVRRDRLEDVGVDFELEPVAVLGCCLSCGDRSREACRALEDALLTFPSCRAVLRDTIVDRRAGRRQFWSESIRSAFPKLNEQGLLTFAPDRADSKDPYGHEARVNCLVASLDSKRIVTGSEDGTIIVWDTEQGTPIREWFAAVPAGPIRSLALSPDGQRLVSVAGASVYRDGGPPVVWDIGGGNGGLRKVATLEPEGQKGRASCAWSFDGTLIASVSGDGMVHVWDAQTFQRRGGPLSNSPSHAVAWPHCLQFSPNSRYLGWVSDASPPKCCLSQPLTDEPLALYFVDPDPVRQVSTPINAFSFDPESRRIVTAHGDRGLDAPLEEHRVRIWEIATSALLVVVGVPADMWIVDNVSFSPDGLSVLAASVDGSVRIWDADSGEQKALLFEKSDPNISPQEDRSPLQTARFSPDGRYVAIAYGIYRPGCRFLYRGIVSLWRTSDASCVAEFIDHQAAWVLDAVFTPNGNFLASADKQGMVHIRPLSRLIEY